MATRTPGAATLTGLRLHPVALGCGGSLLLALAAWSIGALPRRAGVEWLPGLPVPVLPVVAAWACWVLGLAALSAAWILLRRTRDLGVGRVAAAAALWILPLLLVPPIGSSDVYSYNAHGELASLGLDPGEYPPHALGWSNTALLAVDPIWTGVVSAYGPASTAMSEVAVRVADHRLVPSILLLRLWAVAGVALLGAGVAVLARRLRSDAADALLLAVAGPLTVVHLVGGAHNEAMMAGLVACALAVASVRPSRWLLAAAVCGVAAAVKVPALLAAPYLGWVAGGPVALVGGRIARAALGLAVAVAALALTGVAAGVGWGWVDGLSAAPSVTSLLSVSTTLGLAMANLVGQEGRSPALMVGVRQVFQVASCAIAGLLIWRAPVLGVGALGGALLAIAALGPAVHPWYLTWGFAPLAVYLAGQRARWFVAMSVVATASTLPRGGGLVSNLGKHPLVLAMLLAATLAAVVMAASRRRPEAEPLGADGSLAR